MPDGGELSITASKAQDTISLSLTYTGVGIPEAVRQKKSSLQSQRQNPRDTDWAQLWLSGWLKH